MVLNLNSLFLFLIFFQIFFAKKVFINYPLIENDQNGFGFSLINEGLEFLKMYQNETNYIYINKGIYNEKVVINMKNTLIRFEEDVYIHSMKSLCSLYIQNCTDLVIDGYNNKKVVWNSICFLRGDIRNLTIQNSNFSTMISSAVKDEGDLKSIREYIVMKNCSFTVCFPKFKSIIELTSSFYKKIQFIGNKIKSLKYTSNIIRIKSVFNLEILNNTFKGNKGNILDLFLSESIVRINNNKFKNCDNCIFVRYSIRENEITNKLRNLTISNNTFKNFKTAIRLKRKKIRITKVITYINIVSCHFYSDKIFNHHYKAIVVKKFNFFELKVKKNKFCYIDGINMFFEKSKNGILRILKNNFLFNQTSIGVNTLDYTRNESNITYVIKKNKFNMGDKIVVLDIGLKKPYLFFLNNSFDSVMNKILVLSNDNREGIQLNCNEYKNMKNLTYFFSFKNKEIFKINDINKCNNYEIVHEFYLNQNYTTNHTTISNFDEIRIKSSVLFIFILFVIMVFTALILIIE